MGDLRAPLKDVTGIDADLQSLVLRGIVLDDNDVTLSDAGVTEGCRIMLIGSERGVVDQLKQEDMANACKEVGNESLKAGRLEDAIASYSEAIEICPSNHIYLSNRSAAFLKRGVEGSNNSYTSQADFTAAAADARRCIKLAPDFVKGYGRLAQALDGLCEFAEASAACEAGLAKAPEDQSLQRLQQLVAQKAVNAQANAGTFMFCAQNATNTMDERRCIRGGTADATLLAQVQAAGTGTMRASRLVQPGEDIFGGGLPLGRDMAYVDLQGGAWEVLLQASSSLDPRCRFTAARALQHAVMHEEYYERVVKGGGVAALCLLAKDMPLFAGAVEAAMGLANVCKATQGLLTCEVHAGENSQCGRRQGILQRVGGGTDQQVRQEPNSRP